jgi:hypothetical protein
MDDIFLSGKDFKIVGGAPDYRISKSLQDYPTGLSSANLSRSPHTVLEDCGMKWTSFSMFLQKQ